MAAGDQTGVNSTGTGGNVNVSAGDVTDAGSTGDAGSITSQAGIASGTGSDGNIDELTGDDGAHRVRTQTTGFEETTDDGKTYAAGSVSVTNVAPVDVVTVGSILTNGLNKKFFVEVTSVDSTDDTSVSSTVIIQTFYRSGGTVLSLTPNLGTPDKQDTGVVSTFATDIDFTLAVSGSDIVLRATNSGNDTRTGHVTVRWKRQEGGLSA